MSNKLQLTRFLAIPNHSLLFWDNLQDPAQSLVRHALLATNPESIDIIALQDAPTKILALYPFIAASAIIDMRTQKNLFENILNQVDCSTAKILLIDALHPLFLRSDQSQTTIDPSLLVFLKHLVDKCATKSIKLVSVLHEDCVGQSTLQSINDILYFLFSTHITMSTTHASLLIEESVFLSIPDIKTCSVIHKKSATKVEQAQFGFRASSNPLESWQTQQDVEQPKPSPPQPEKVGFSFHRTLFLQS